MRLGERRGEDGLPGTGDGARAKGLFELIAVGRECARSMGGAEMALEPLEERR